MYTKARGWIVCTLAAILFGVVVTARAQNLTCPSSPSSAVGKDFSGQNLGFANFSNQDLTNANFSGATFLSAVFINANLTGVNFSGATFNSTTLNQVTDFTLANLTSACFNDAKFNTRTYFSYANLTSTDFSNTDISGIVTFGESPSFGGTPRAAFRNTKMSCEFIDDWKNLDLAGANIRSCGSMLAGRDFSGADFSIFKSGSGAVSVDFSGFDLSGTNFQNTDLSGANFTGAMMKSVNLSSSKLYGAQLINANLESANLSGVHLTNNPPNVLDAAHLSGAYLKNANLSKAFLQGSDLTNASFYSTTPVGTGTCTIKNGITNNCASAAGTTLDNTQFAAAYLFGVDFTNTKVQGVDFSGAVLIGSNFTGATLEPSINAGTDATFEYAFLQGVNLETAKKLTMISAYQALVDFSTEGNTIFVLLDGHHTAFPGWKTPGEAVCVEVTYGSGTTVPTKTGVSLCPDGSQASDNFPIGCGANGGKHWNAGVDLSTTTPKASYFFDATYTKKAADICTVMKGSDW